MWVGPRWHLRPWLSGALVAVAITTVVVAVVATVRPAAEHCVGPTAMTYMNMDGSAASVPGPSVATVYHYAFNPGDDIKQIQPPASFDPRTASNQELMAFGFSPRPSSRPALTAWEAKFAHWKGFTSGGHKMCTNGKSHG
jgi:hypothetical protein